MAIVFLGDKAEAIKAQSLLQGPMLNQCGGTLESLMSWIAACSVIVSPDSGPAHMAAALEIPVVTLFGCTSPARWAPIGSNAEVVRIGLPCSPCSNHGLNTCPVGTLECMLQLKAPSGVPSDLAPPWEPPIVLTKTARTQPAISDRYAIVVKAFASASKPMHNTNTLSIKKRC